MRPGIKREDGMKDKLKLLAHERPSSPACYPSYGIPRALPHDLHRRECHRGHSRCLSHAALAELGGRFPQGPEDPITGEYLSGEARIQVHRKPK
jgi:hypothetical protein